MSRITSGQALLLLALLPLALAGCCRQDFAGVMLVNDTPQTLLAQVEGMEGDPWEIEPGKDFILPGQPGPATLKWWPVGFPKEEKTRAVNLELEQLTLVAADADKCLVMADYTAQYEGQGQIKVVTTTSGQRAGKLKELPFQGTTYYGPQDKLPPTIRDDEQVMRFVHAPCELLKDPQKLHDWLYQQP